MSIDGDSGVCYVKYIKEEEEIFRVVVIWRIFLM